jgi:hypothetical protein
MELTTICLTASSSARLIFPDLLSPVVIRLMVWLRDDEALSDFNRVLQDSGLE